MVKTKKSDNERREVADLQMRVAEAFEESGAALSRPHCELLATQVVGARKYMAAYFGERPVSLIQGFCIPEGWVEIYHEPEGKLTVRIEIEIEDFDDDEDLEIGSTDWPTTEALPGMLPDETREEYSSRMFDASVQQHNEPQFPSGEDLIEQGVLSQDDQMSLTAALTLIPVENADGTQFVNLRIAGGRPTFS
jgi:hypothetical protein